MKRYQVIGAWLLIAFVAQLLLKTSFDMLAHAEAWINPSFVN